MSEITRLGENENNKKPQNIPSCYVDPNTDLNLYGTDNDAKGFVPGGGNSGQLIIPPEDLSIYVSLMMIPHRASEWGKGDDKNIEIAFEMNKQSIPSGSDMGYTNARVRYLTTDYLDYGWDMWHSDNTEKYKYGQHEALGIQNINIEYNPNNAPIATVTFIDIMGLSTFAPMQSEYESEGKSAVTSLFKGLFTTPYPRFLLTVKGYYGVPITHSLGVTKVTNTINPDNGNITIVVEFLGYQWKRYNDVSAKWMFVSPFLESPTDMREKWKARNYKYKNDKPVPTYEELRYNINKAIETLGKLPESSEHGRTQIMINEVQVISQQLVGEINKIKDIPLDGVPTTDVLPTERRYIGSLEYETFSSQPSIIRWEMKGWVDVNSDLYTEHYNNIEDRLRVKLVKYNEEIEFLSNHDWDELDKACEVLNIFYVFYNQPDVEERKTVIFYDLRKLIETLEKNKNTINTEVKKRDAELMNIVYDQALEVVNNLPFVPTMYNVVKWIFAHYVHFLESFVEVSKPSEHRFSNTGVPLLPWFTIQENLDGNGYVQKYPYNKPELPEVQYTNALHDELIKIRARIAELEAIATTSEETIDISQSRYIWRPIFPYDISYRLAHTGVDEINPYKKVLENYQNLYEAIGNIGIQIITRMFACIGTRENTDNIEAFAHADAENIYNAIKGETKLCTTIKDDLECNDFLKFLLFVLIGSNTNSKWGLDNMKPMTYKYAKHHTGFTRMGAFDNSGGVTLDMDLNTVLRVMPLTTMTFNEIKNNISGGNYLTDITNVYLFNFNSSWALENQYHIMRGNMNLIKGSYNIIDLTKQTSHNIITLYNHFILNNKGIVENIWFNADNGYKEEEKKCFSNDRIHIISGNNDFLKNRRIGSETNLITTISSLRDSLVSTNTDVHPNQISISTPELISRLRRDRDNNSICIAIPQFANNVLSFFATPEYYDYNTLVQNVDLRNRCKAMLLLRTLGIQIPPLNVYIANILKNWGLRRIPKCLALLIGGVCWLDENRTRINLSNLPNLNNIFGNNNTNFANLQKLEYDVKTVFISYFEEWVEKEGKKILSDLEYGDYENGNMFMCDNGLNTHGQYPFNTNQVEHNIRNLPAYKSAIAIHTQRGHEPTIQYIIDPSSDAAKSLMNLYRDDVLIINSRSGVLKSGDNARKPDITISDENIITYKTALCEKLLSLLKIEEIVVNTPSEQSTITTQINEQIKNLYLQLKFLHDTWLVGITDLDKTDRLEHIMSKVVIVDQHFCDISDKLFVNLNLLNQLLKQMFQESTNYTLTSLLSKIAGENNSMIFSSPMLGFFKGDKNVCGHNPKDFLHYLFKPYIYNEIVSELVKDEDFGLVIMLMVNPSTTPTNLNNEKSEFENTALQLTYENNMLVFNKGYQLTGNTVGNQPLRAFGVSYGRQNESFFQIKQLSNTETFKTEQEIRALAAVVERAGENSSSSVYVGEDMYSIYSKRPYMATIDVIGGSAPLFPMMYFQLNNSYIYTGAYKIFKVKHSITSNNFMRTEFQGVKTSLVKTELVKIPIIQSIVGDLKLTNRLTTNYKIESAGEYQGDSLGQIDATSGTGSRIYGPSSHGVTPVKDNLILGNEYRRLRDKKISKYYRLRECVERGSNNVTMYRDTGVQTAGFELPVECLQNICDFMIQVDKILDWVTSKEGLNIDAHNVLSKISGTVGGMENFCVEKSKFNVTIGSMWRHHSNSQSKTSYHGYGSAIDLRLTHKSPRNRNFVDVRGRNDLIFHRETLYKFIKENMCRFITELYLEYKNGDINDLNTVHYAYTINSTKHDICREMGLNSDRRWTCTSDSHRERC